MTCSRCDRPDRHFTKRDRNVCTDCRNDARRARRRVGGGDLRAFVDALVADLRQGRDAVYSHHLDMGIAIGICIVRIQAFAARWRSGQNPQTASTARLDSSINSDSQASVDR